MKEIEQILHGGDYNPNQWPEEIWREDLAWFQRAHLNAVTLNVFSWARLQPAEDEYDFAQLDRMIALYADAGFDIVLATATAAMPAWMFKRYPEVARVNMEGKKMRFGRRHNACPNSLVYQRFAGKLAGKLAQRYGANPAVKLWHINNEYGGACFCENCEKAFRRWLKKRYQSLEALNRAWNMEFWSHTLYDWDEIVAPNQLSEVDKKRGSAFEGISVDYRRFMNESMLNNFRMERDEIRRYDRETPTTTNLMGTYKNLNYHTWGPEMDLVSWDCYPGGPDIPSTIAFRHSLMRGLKEGKPFWIMEQNPTQQTYSNYTKKEPGKMRAWSYQALAHGADALLYFQLKNSEGANEKYCGSVLGHAGHGNTRIFREVAELGQELQRIGGQLLNSRLESPVALLYDWESYWAVDYDRHRGTNKDLDYVETAQHFYRAFHQGHIQTDVISPRAALSKYKLLVAPALYMVSEQVQGALEDYVKNGGNLMLSYMSGIVRESTNVILGGYPGAFRKLAGVWVEESDYLERDIQNQLCFEEGGSYSCGQMCDILHLEGAKVLAHYSDETFFYKGLPAVTVHEYGKGKVWYVGTRLEKDGLAALTGRICRELDIKAVLQAQAGLEVTCRSHEAADFYFVLSYEKEAKTLPEALVGCTDIVSGKTLKKDMQLGQFELVIARRDK